jgi:hypothetical protein
MRTSLFGALFAIALVAAAAGAQHPGLGVGGFFSYVLPDPIYEATTPGLIGDQQLDHVTLRATPVIGVRVTALRDERWTVAAEAAYGSTKYDYVIRMPFDQYIRTADGSVVTMLLSIDRTVARTDGLRLGALLQGGIHRLAVNPDPVICVSPAPSPACPGVAPAWQRAYNVPSVGGGITLETRLGDRMTLDFRGTSSLGRADTRSFWTDLPPSLDQYEADRSHWLRVTQLSAGLEIGL